MKYEVAIVSGTGVSEEGDLRASGRAKVEWAVGLWRAGTVENLLFSGRWPERYAYTPLQGEAEAMQAYAMQLGVPSERIQIETRSRFTIENFCFCKDCILEPMGWRRVVLVCINPLYLRSYEHFKWILGPGYLYDLELAPFEYPPTQLFTLKANEEEKLEGMQRFYESIRPGDHRAVLQRASMVGAVAAQVPAGT